MNPGIGEHRLAQFANFQSECSIFKRLLHCATFEETEITTTFGRAAVAELRCQLLKGILLTSYLLSVI